MLTPFSSLAGILRYCVPARAERAEQTPPNVRRHLRPLYGRGRRSAPSLPGAVHCVISTIVAVALASSLRAQVSPQVPPDQAAKLQVLQPTPDITSPVTATATFDPPMARVGQNVYYRVALDGAGESIPWPGAISAPAELKFGPVSQGQLMQFFGNKFRPLKSYLYPVQAT